MKSLYVLIICLPLVACNSSEKKEEGKGLDVDRIQCAWNKTSDEAKEQCKPDPSKPQIGERLDTQLKKDAKTMKNFFGIKGEPEKPQAPAPGSSTEGK